MSDLVATKVFHATRIATAQPIENGEPITVLGIIVARGNATRNILFFESDGITTISHWRGTAFTNNVSEAPFYAANGMVLGDNAGINQPTVTVFYRPSG